MSSLKQKAQEILDIADIKINGDRPWDIKIHNSQTYSRVFSSGNLGLGEAYMDGWWDCEQLDVFFDRLITARILHKIQPRLFIGIIIKSKLLNLQNKARATQVGQKHYDIGNDLFTKMLDPYMQYSCGYWKNAKTLSQAQQHKLDLICKKLELKPGMKVLDIGCGWGGFAKYAASKYKVEVTGITISREQQKFAQKFCKGLPVKIEFLDYRDISGKFDRILSIGMFEHVGSKNYKTYFQITNESLRDDGLALVHTIGFHKTQPYGEPWYTKYIFPNGYLPSIKQIGQAMEGNFRMEDWHCFGAYYDHTMMAWYKNFEKSWPEIKSHYDERFFRMWRYYLLSTAGLWRSRYLELWQVVMSKYGVRGGYTSIR